MTMTARDPRPACLVDAHWADLQRSGLAMETVLAAGIHSGSADEVREILGFGSGAGMVIPYPTLNGDERSCHSLPLKRRMAACCVTPFCGEMSTVVYPTA